jgi:mono/diheme cytochrome c family protein
MIRIVLFTALLVPGGCAPGPAARLYPVPQSEAEVQTLAMPQRGAAYARENCAGCHAVGATGDSPLPAAPQFRSLGERYPIDDLAEAFAEGIDTAHQEMPEFVMSTTENTDLLAYLKSIQTRSTR